MSEEEKQEETKQEETKQEETKPQTFTLKVNGQDKIVTLEEMQELATKSAGADENFRKAAEIKKEAEKLAAENAEAKEIKATFNKLFKSADYTKADIRKFGELVGMDEEDMEEMFKAELKKAGKQDPDPKTPLRKLKMEDLDDDLQEVLKQTKQTQVEDANKKIVEKCENYVDKDEYFGKILKDTKDKDLRESRRASIIKMLQTDVYRKILASKYTNEQFGDQMVKGSVQDLRATIKSYGIPDGTSKQPPSQLLSGLGLSPDLQTKVQTGESIERVPVDDPNYIDNFVARLAQKQGVK